MLKFGNTYLNFGGTYLSGWLDPYNPLNLPSNTVRVRTNDGKVPYKLDSDTRYETATLVPGTNDVYDVYKSGTSFIWLFQNSKNIVEVLGANTNGITNMDGMFKDCFNLTTVPLFNTSKVTRMASMFKGCINVETGALALYQQVSSQTTPPSNYKWAFCDCGSNTQTGAAELAQIPDDWK